MSDQESSVFIGPFRDNENNCYLRQLWDRKLYRFLRSWFRTVEMDPTIGPDERGLTRIKKTDSGESWGIPPGDGGGNGMYASYFRVIDASDGDGCKIGVTDGGWLGSGSQTNCGVVKVNGTRVYVPVFTGDSIAAEDTYYVWLHSWVDVDGIYDSEIIVGDSTPPDNPNSGTAYGSQLLGRFTVVESGGAYLISAITQDYLRGGEHGEILVGPCGSDVTIEL